MCIFWKSMLWFRVFLWRTWLMLHSLQERKKKNIWITFSTIYVTTGLKTHYWIISVTKILQNFAVANCFYTRLLCEQGYYSQYSNQIWAGWYGVWIPVWARDNSLLKNIQISSVGYRGGSLWEVKLLRHEVNHSSPTSAKVKNEWSCTPAPCICFHGTGREKFTLLTFLTFIKDIF